MARVEYVVTLVVGIELIEVPGRTERDVDGALMRHVDDTMHELERRWIDDSSVDLDLGRKEATFRVLVDSGDEARAVDRARSLLSMAVHAAGGATPTRPFPRGRGLVGDPALGPVHSGRHHLAGDRSQAAAHLRALTSRHDGGGLTRYP